MSSYAASKAGIVRFIETIAVELEDTNIDANCIAPGAVNTGMIDEIISQARNSRRKFILKIFGAKNSGALRQSIVQILQFF